MAVAVLLFALVFVVFNRFCSGLREDSFFLSQWLLAFASVPWNMGALGDCFVWLPSISATVLNIEPSSILIEQIKKSERSFVMKVPSLWCLQECQPVKTNNLLLFTYPLLYFGIASTSVHNLLDQGPDYFYISCTLWNLAKKSVLWRAADKYILPGATARLPLFRLSLIIWMDGCYRNCTAPEYALDDVQ